ncbi:MAG: hypothetical protein HY078_09015 [Elusimicrobia bacterium]|nr:hypothetical protein [Elusimicrobiota bacterium]
MENTNTHPHQHQDASWASRDVARILFKRWWAPLPTMAASAAIAILVILFWTPTYESNVQFWVSTQNKSETAVLSFLDAGGASGTALTHAALLKSQDLLKDVVLALNLQNRKDEPYYSTPKRRVLSFVDRALDAYKDAEAYVYVHVFGSAAPKSRARDKVMEAVEKLEKRINAEGLDRTDVVKFTVKDYDPDMSARIANRIARSYLLFTLTEQATELAAQYGAKHPLRVQLADKIDRISQNILNNESPALGDASIGRGVRVIQFAHAPTKPAKPNRKMLLIAAMAGGLIGGVFLMFALELVDPAFQGTEDIRRALGVPVIGTVSNRMWRRRRSLNLKRKQLDLDAFMPLVYQIDTLLRRNNVRTLCLAATDDSKSNSQLAQVLAFCLSRIERERQDGRDGNVLLIEPELNGGVFLSRPVPSADARKSVSEYFDGSAVIHQAIQPVDQGLALAAIGPRLKGTGLAAYGEDHYRGFLKSAADKYGTVVVRGYNLSRRQDSLMLHSLCDSTILIVNEETSRKKPAKHLMHLLHMNGAKVLGVVVNNKQHHVPRFLYKVL